MLSRMTFFQKRARTKLFIPAFLLATSAALLHAQRPQGGPVGDFVVDFVVVDASGQPATGLQPADVAIKIAGKARTITALELKRFDAGGAGPAPATAAPAAEKAAVPPPFTTNAGGGAAAAASSAGRTVIIVVDQDSLRAGSERAIVASLEPFLKTLTAADRVAMYTTPRDTAQAGFNTGLAGVRAALAKLGGQKSASSGSNDNICRSADTLQQLRSMIEGLPPSDKPTTMIFFGSGLSVPAKTGSGASTTCEVTNDHYRVLSSSVAATRVNMFVVQGDEGYTGRDDGLENLAGVTSAGPVLRVTGPGLARVTAESASYYVATIKGEPDDKAGQTQRLELKVNKEGLTTRARNDVAFMRSAGPAAGGPAAKPGAASAADMLRNSNASFPDLKLNATAIVSRGPAGKGLAILTLVEPADPSVKLKELTAGVVDIAAGKIQPFRADEKQLAARPIALPMSAEPGKVKIRVAAVDEGGKGGAVDVDLSTELTPAGPMKLGGIMLLAPRWTSFSPQITFSTEEEVGVYLEIYGDVSKGLSAKVEIAATPDGPAIETTKPGGAGTTEADKFILNAKLPISKLAPGDYVVRAIIQVPDQPEGRVMRTLRKVAK
jgi:hypothetical protein